MKPKVKLTINAMTGEGSDEAIRAVEEYKRWLNDCCKRLVERLAAEGMDVAGAKFAVAQYDGTNDVEVAVDERGELTRAVVALGEAALFIEFGTGVYYPDDHPEKPQGILGRGEYGKGRGKQRTWGYYGDPGTNGVEKTKKNGNTVVLTHGNPASQSMYGAARELEQRFKQIVAEVFT